MTTLEQQAREAAEAAFRPGSGRLGGKLYAGEPAKEGFRERSWFKKGFLAAAEPREREIEALQAALNDTVSLLREARGILHDAVVTREKFWLEEMSSTNEDLVERIDALLPPIPLPEEESK